MRILTLSLVLLAGCTLYPFDGDGDDVCVQRDLARPAPASLVNPETLTCEQFSYGSPCNTECGPCAGGATYIPPWGRCDSECTGLDETQCEAAPTCRVARMWDAFYVGLPSFEGCYQITSIDAADGLASCTGEDAETCSRRAHCTGLYDVTNCGVGDDAPRAAFRECIDESLVPGTCDGQVACRALAPTCPANTTPGVANGCWTGSCLPNSLCGFASGG